MARAADATDWDAALARAAKGERVIVRRGGRRFGIISDADLDRLDQFDRLEDEAEIEAARAALAEGPARPYEELRRQLGLT